MTKGEGSHQRNTRTQNVHAIKNAFITADNGLTKTELNKITGISRPTIDLFLKIIPGLKENLKHQGKRLYWKGNYEKQLGEQMCHTWIGKIPIAFSKTIEGMRSHLMWEKNLRKRHLRALQELRSNIEKAEGPLTHSNWKYFEARVADEVGWRLEDYLEKLEEKMEKENDFGKKMMIYYGISEDKKKE